ncbi:MarR family winged helix-turn-helix transcriptional regulator [Nocardia tengchongensis]|uniref:MarR family winged helix-turn-helix transcriptional regulator n=1 Tax=Nocardia tengchongensis TaxID=2055889 RepID=UPI003683A139
MPQPEPLNPDEDLVWRNLMRVCSVLPRELHADMSRAAGLLVNEYMTLMALSEAPDRRLRMAALSREAGLSPSRMTRVIDNLQTRGLVSKETSSADGRGNEAVLTDAGFAKVQEAWPTHIRSVRARAFDRIDPRDLEAMGRGLSAIAEGLDGSAEA